MGYGNVMLVVVSFCFAVGRLALNVWFCFRKLRIPVSFHHLQFSLLKEVGIFSFFLLLNMVIDQINWNVDKLILGHTGGTNEVAVYGVACQIAGLKKYLGKEYDRLLTIDVLCHGVPSPKIWNLYLENQERKHHAKITSIQFRDKTRGWKLYSMKILFANGREYAVPFTNDTFMNMFLGNIDLRPACHDCRFKEFPRVSDMTIGDCWGIENYMPEMDDDKGTSVILLHTEKGLKMLNEIQADMALQRAELDRALPISAESRKSVGMHPNRKKYWAGVYRGEHIDVLHGYVRKSFLQKVVGLIRYKLNILIR